MSEAWIQNLDDLDQSHCAGCGLPFLWSEEFLIGYCERCDSWAEERCHSTECIFCPFRPDRPTLEEPHDFTWSKSQCFVIHNGSEGRIHIFNFAYPVDRIDS